MKHCITELCLTQGQGVTPFAVLIEQGEHCTWALPSMHHEHNAKWLSHLLEGKQRRGEEWWTLQAWRDWLINVCKEPPDRRRFALERLERSTPGCVVRRPKTVSTRLPASTMATRWCRDRLFNRAELIAAKIAANLAINGSAHWQSVLMIDERFSFEGDWVIEASPKQRSGNSSIGLAVIKAINLEQIESIKKHWNNSKTELGIKYPFGIAVVHDWRGVEILDEGCFVGDRFPAPVSLAVASIRAWWGTCLRQPDTDEEYLSTED